MSENINFLYCFDKNYNLQAFSSMISLLNNATIKLNIYVIHNEDNFQNQVPSEILNHNNLNFFNSYKFTNYDHSFPNIENVHISVATYFRLFIKDYLPSEEKYYIFMDPDVICIKDPVNEIKNTIEKLNVSKFTIAAKTEHDFGVERIGVSDKYFNAGVMIIDFIKWQQNNYHEKLLHRLKELKNNIVQWDQDVLNSLINGEYLELNEILNFKAATKVDETFKNKVLFVHYMGSHKPWLTSGLFQKDSNFYHQNFKLISGKNFHIEHKWRIRSLFDFLIAILSLKIFRLKKPVVFIIEFAKSFSKNKN
tara:strand:- start:699 stop:1622 length:924 start_codon:yes stop_codon:yes gene_type:complete